MSYHKVLGTKKKRFHACATLCNNIFTKMNQDISPLCWHNCQSTGSLLHILWGCSVIHSFWSEVSDRYKMFQSKHYSTINKWGPIEIPQILWNCLLNKKPKQTQGDIIILKHPTPLKLQSKLPNMIKWEK